MFWGRKDKDVQPGSSGKGEPASVPAAGSADGNTPPPSRGPGPAVSRRVSVTPVAPAHSGDTLPQVLLSQGHVTDDQMRRALERQKDSGEFIGDILVEQGALDANSLVTFLAKYCKIPHISLLDYLIDESLFELIPRKTCMDYRLIPVDKLGRNLTIAMVNPLDKRALQKVYELCPGLRIKPILCAHRQFEAVMSRMFKGERKSRTPEYLANLMKAAPVPAGAVPETASVETGADTAPEATPAEMGEFDGSGGDAVIESVFHPSPEEQNSDVLAPPDEAPGEEGGDSGGAEEMTLRMTTVMMSSMRNTYGVLARRMQLFRGLSPEEVARMFSRGKTEEYLPGDVLFAKGDTGDKMYVVLNGCVEIQDGDRMLARVSQGEMFGEMALVSQAPRSAAAVVAEQSSLLALSMDDITRALQPDTAIQLLVNIVITLSERLRVANLR